MGGTSFRLWVPPGPLDGDGAVARPKLQKSFDSLGPRQDGAAPAKEDLNSSAGPTGTLAAAGMDSRGRGAGWDLEEGVSDAVWQSRISVVGRPTLRGLSSRKRGTGR